MNKSFCPRTVDLFSKLSHQNIIIFCIVQVLFIGWLDCVTNDYALIILYLFPVFLTSWFAGTSIGFLFCILSIAARLAADFWSGSVFYRYPAVYYWNIITEFAVLLLMSLLFSILKNTLDADKRRSKIDPLTGALNRSSFFEQAEHELNRARRHHRFFSVIYLDIDNFKKINEQFGYQTGDELLVVLASVLENSIRNYESLSRFSGDEFILLMPEADEEAALSYLSKIRSELKQAIKSKNWDAEISMCALVYLTAPNSVDEILRTADEIMYSVKKSEKSSMLHTVIK